MIKHVLLDMDGVLADLETALAKAHGYEPRGVVKADKMLPWALEKVWGIDDPVEFWRPANSVDFWEGLAVLEDGRELVEWTLRTFGKENVGILSSPPRAEEALIGKKRWIEKHFPMFRRQYMFASSKYFCAHEGNVLIDDHDKNIKFFREKGGIGWAFPRPWNENWRKSDKPVEASIDFLRSGV